MDKQRSLAVKCTSYRAALIINSLLLLTIGLIAAILILVVQQVLWGVIWLLFGLAVAQIVLIQLLHRRQVACQLNDVTTAMLDVVDTQAAALQEQQHQIEHLRTILTADPGLTNLRGVLEQQTTPRLDLLVERLTQAEEALPEMLPQTRAWVSDLRRLAIQTQAHIESLSDEVARRD